MRNLLREWLNGSRDYYKGVAIYIRLDGNPSVIAMLQQGKNDYRQKRLEEILLDKFNELPDDNKALKLVHHVSLHNKIVSTANDVVASLQADTAPVNPELYNACKKEADLLYKQNMNDRAALFAMAKPNDVDHINTPDKIKLRGELALKILKENKRVSELYDTADFVKLNGRLPDQDEEETTEEDEIPDHLVKQTLDNLRKNYNKIIKKEPNARRVASIQEHEQKIKKLEERWRLLK